MAFKNYDSSGNVLSRSLTDLPVGTIVSTALSAAPSGWLICDGTAVSRTNYPELFGALGTGYGAGDGTTTFNVPNSDGQMILAISTAQRIGVAMPPQFVTTLPASPIDGTEVYYQSTTAGTGGGASSGTSSMADTGAMWRLRYRAASSKWEFVGGSPLVSVRNSTSATASVSGWTSGSGGSGNADPHITVPLPGTYIVEHGAGISGNATTSWWIGLNIAGVNPGNSDVGTMYVTGAGASIYQMISSKSVITWTASTTEVLQRFQQGGTSVVYTNMSHLSITPIRVSA